MYLSRKNVSVRHCRNMEDNKKNMVCYARTEMLEGLFDSAYVWEFLSEDRKEKIHKFQNKNDKLRAFSAGLLLEYGLRQYGRTQSKPEVLGGRQTENNIRRVKIIYGVNGKPMIEGENKVYFNLSHSGNYVAAAFAGQEIGIDVERLRSGKQKVAEHFFSEEEKKFLRENWEDSFFTKIWTRKESYIKADGRGMGVRLDTFSVLSDCILPFYFSSYSLQGKAWLSVCMKNEKPDMIPQEVDLKRFIEMEVRNSCTMN